MAAVEYGPQRRRLGLGAYHLPNREMWITPRTPQAPTQIPAHAPHPAYSFTRRHTAPLCTTPIHTAGPAAQRVAHALATLITRIFGSARYPYPAPQSAWQATLPTYIARALARSALPLPVVIGAMALLLRYKDAVPYSVAYGNDAARLFLAAVLVSAKVADAAKAPLEWWADIGGGVFGVRELKRMERELCRVLQWDVLPDRATHAWLAGVVRALCEEELDAGGGGGYGIDDDDDGREDDSYMLLDVDVGGAGEESDDEEWDLDWDDDDSASARNHRLNPPPPAYHDAVGAPPFVEPRAAPAYTVVRPAQGHTPADVEDRMRLARAFAAPALPPPARCCGLRHRPAGAHARAPSSEREEERRSGGVLAALRERVGQLVQRRPRVPPRIN
ncbi:hypothetical protein HYPSUDRAFT_55796 [Hypholoma sublateritium FD-334 SS-4]|uniref:Uncharacterized protein n=1 Tax=Hypholoma sublateritium (strain FD-334 SS-4) TaxID=945553 RepID=A0A0D2MC51_HYPSF|nr:hypothetical protein HYPSUDRAFT_55796 [Hypholoma sublateritium FD-334 SS-4]